MFHKAIFLFSEYFKRNIISENCLKYVFRSMIKTKTFSTLQKTDKHISNIRVNKNVLEMLKEIGANI